MDDNRLNTIIGTSLENLKQIVDVNTVVGEPINGAGGTVIIPVSKVSMGYVSSGSDYAGKHSTTKNNFIGLGSTGVTLLPLGFLIVKNDGSAEFISVETKTVTNTAKNKLDSIFSFVEKTPDIAEKFKNVFMSKDSDEDEE